MTFVNRNEFRQFYPRKITFEGGNDLYLQKWVMSNKIECYVDNCKKPLLLQKWLWSTETNCLGKMNSALKRNHFHWQKLLLSTEIKSVIYNAFCVIKKPLLLAEIYFVHAKLQVSRLNPTVENIFFHFIMFASFVFFEARLVPYKWNQVWHS